MKISEFYDTDIYNLLSDKESNHNFNNTYDNSNVNNAVETVNYHVSEKLVEQYEAHIKDLQDRNQELKELAAYWKSKTEESKS